MKNDENVKLPREGRNDDEFMAEMQKMMLKRLRRQQEPAEAEIARCQRAASQHRLLGNQETTINIAPSPKSKPFRAVSEFEAVVLAIAAAGGLALLYSIVAG